MRTAENDIAVELIEMTDSLHDKVTQDDKSILNMLWKSLDRAFAYNCITLHTTFPDYDPAKSLSASDSLSDRAQALERVCPIHLSWSGGSIGDWIGRICRSQSDPDSKIVEGEGAQVCALVYTYSCDLVHINI